MIPGRGCMVGVVGPFGLYLPCSHGDASGIDESALKGRTGVGVSPVVEMPGRPERDPK